MNSLMYGLELRRADEREAADISERYGVTADAEVTYVMSSSNGGGFLISGRPSWRKANRKIEEPTLFDFSQPWPPGDDVTWGDIE